MSTPGKSKGRGRGGGGGGVQANRPGTADSKRSSASNISKSVTRKETISLKQLKDAAVEVRSAIEPSDLKKFDSFFNQLEIEIRSGEINTYKNTLMKQKQLENFLAPSRVKPQVGKFIGLLKKLQRCLENGNSEVDPFKYVIRSGRKPVSKEEETEELKEELACGGLQPESQAMPIRQKPSQNIPRRNQITSNTTKKLTDLQSILISRYEKLRDETIPPGMLTDKTSDSDLLDNIKKLAQGFADAAEEAAPKVATSNLKGKMNQRAQDEEMKHTSTELDCLISELESPKAQTKWSKESNSEMARRVRKARNMLAEEKRSNESKEKDMKQLNEEIENLLDEINNPKPQTKWSKEPEGELPLRVRQARKVLSNEKKTTESTGMNTEQMNQEIQLLKQDIENLDNERFTPKNTKTKTDAETVKELKVQRTELAFQKKKLFSVLQEKTKAAEAKVSDLREFESKIDKIWNTLPQERRTYNETCVVKNQLEDIKATIERQKQELSKLQNSAEEVNEAIFQLKDDIDNLENENYSPALKTKHAEVNDIRESLASLKTKLLSARKNSDTAPTTELKDLEDIESKVGTIWEKLPNEKKSGTDKKTMEKLDEVESALTTTVTELTGQQNREELWRREMLQLKEGIEHLDDEAYSFSTKQPLTCSEIQQLREAVETKRHKILAQIRKRVEAEQKRQSEMIKQLDDLWKLVFGIPRKRRRGEATEAESGDNDSEASLLQEINEKLRPCVEKTSEVMALIESDGGKATKEKSLLSQCTQLADTFKNWNPVIKEAKNVKSTTDFCIAMLEKIYVTLSDTFCYTEQPMANVGQNEMHTLTFIVQRVYDCVDYSTHRNFVDSSLFLQPLHKLYFNITGQHRQKSDGRKQKAVKDAHVGLGKFPAAEMEEMCKTLTERFQKVYEAMQNLEKEKSSLLNRLSKVASANLTHENSNIADLSDPNRATKLAEMYSELYDNAWTDAFEELENKTKEEKDRIKFLLEILTDSYHQCEKLSEQQQDSIARALTNAFSLAKPGLPDQGGSTKTQKEAEAPKLSTIQAKALTDIRKQTAEEFIPSLQKLLEKKKKYTVWFEDERLCKYSKECIRLCWWMRVQSPPVVIKMDSKQGAKFDSDRYKEYMKSGKTVDFVVWPPLYLSAGGSLLRKGVAQGK